MTTTTRIVKIPFRTGTTEQNDAYLGASGEITIDRTKRSLRVHDGIKQGGEEILRRSDLDEVRDLVDSANGLLEPAITAAQNLTAAIPEVTAARDAAVSAQGLAQGARDAAVSAKGLAEGARDTAVSASQGITTARDAAVAAKGQAETARDAAVGAKGQAETARDAAVGARDAAIGVKNLAESARDEAVGARADAITAKDAAVSAKDQAVTQKDAAVAAKDDAVTAKGQAETARDAAVAAKGLAEGARDAAEDFAALSFSEAERAKGFADQASDGQLQADWNQTVVTEKDFIKNKPVLFSGSYNDLSGKPVLFSGSYSDLTSKPALFSGSYTDLTNKPTIPAAQVPSDWNATTGAARILNKPVLFSGAYADLTGKPTLFSGAYADLTGKPALFSGSYNDLTDKPNLAAAQVNSDWNAVSGPAMILNKPAIPNGANYAQLVGATFTGDITLARNAPVLRLKDNSGTTGGMNAWVSYRDGTDTERAWTGYGSNNTSFGITNLLGDIAVYPASGYALKVGTNKVWHEGNDGAGSGLDADLLDGAHADTAATANTIVKRQSGGEIVAAHLNLTHAIGARTTDDVFFSTSGADPYVRKNTKAGMVASLGLGNVNNTSDADKPVSTATQTALNNKANLANPSFTGKVLSANGFANTAYAVNAINPIWRFANAEGFGLSYAQGTAGLYSEDSVDIHFGNAATPQFRVNMSGNAVIAGTLSVSKHVVRTGDGGRILESQNTTAGGAAQFYIDHNLGSVFIGNARGTLTVIGNVQGNATTATTATNAGTAEQAAGNYISGGTEKPNYFGGGKLRLQMLVGSNLGIGSTWNDVLWMSAYAGNDVKASNALIMSKTGDEFIGFARQNYDSADWGPVRTIWHSGNMAAPNVNVSSSTLVQRDSGGHIYANNVVSSGVVHTKVPTVVGTLSAINTSYDAPINIPTSFIGTTNAIAYAPIVRQRTQLTVDGYEQHMAFGAWRMGNGGGWAGGAFIGVGKSDYNVTSAYLFDADGGIKWNGDNRVFWHTGNLNPQTSAVAGSIVQRDGSGYIQGTYIHMTDDGNPGAGAAAVSAIITKQGDNYYRSTDAARVKTFLALGNVNNTSDADKPVSTAQQIALNAKLSAATGNTAVTQLKTASFNSLYDAGNSGSALTINFSNGQKQKVTLNAAAPALTIAAPPGVGHYQLIIHQDATGSRAPTITGPSGASLASNYVGSASVPAINTAANSRTVWNGFWDGAAWSVCSMAKVGAA